MIISSFDYNDCILIKITATYNIRVLEIKIKNKKILVTDFERENIFNDPLVSNSTCWACISF